jgi:hypothetical protein
MESSDIQLLAFIFFVGLNLIIPFLIDILSIISALFGGHAPTISFVGGFILLTCINLFLLYLVVKNSGKKILQSPWNYIILIGFFLLISFVYVFAYEFAPIERFPISNEIIYQTYIEFSLPFFPSAQTVSFVMYSSLILIAIIFSLMERTLSSGLFKLEIKHILLSIVITIISYLIISYLIKAL